MADAVGREVGGERAESTADDVQSQWIYGSDTYGAATTDAQTTFAVDWLEQQALHPFIRETGQRALRLLGLQPGASVLEVGCGTGVFLPALATAVGPSGRIVGLDHSSPLLDEARARVERLGLADQIELVQGDAQALPFEDGQFDAAHCERVLMHLEDPSRAIREMARVVRQGGRVVAAEIAARNAGIIHPDHELERRLGAMLVSGIRHGWMGVELRQRFGDAGLVETRGEAVTDFEDAFDPDEGEEYRKVASEFPNADDRGRAIAMVDEMLELSARGLHCGYATMFIVRGSVPERDSAT